MMLAGMQQTTMKFGCIAHAVTLNYHYYICMTSSIILLKLYTEAITTELYINKITGTIKQKKQTH